LRALCADAALPDAEFALELLRPPRTSLPAQRQQALVGPPPRSPCAQSVPELRLDPASPLQAAAAGVAAYLAHYGCMADRDEDLWSQHWAEDAAFPHGRAAQARAAAAAAAHR